MNLPVLDENSEDKLYCGHGDTSAPLKDAKKDCFVNLGRLLFDLLLNIFDGHGFCKINR